MKKITLLLLFCFVLISGMLAQGIHIRTAETVGDKFLIASLPNTSNFNHGKLKIQIFGGNFSNRGLATRTYSISTRDGLLINQEQTGGSTRNWYDLRVYKSSGGYDFVLESKKNYLSVFIQAWEGIAWEPIQPIKMKDIVKYNPGSNQDITSQVIFNVISSTDEAGNIGIGTESPKSKLDVRGKIIADEVEIKVNKAADFVFEPDYKLRPLSEVESFVKENKHLPEIPSENDMQDKGLNLNEMQMKFLQKIEELTLYVIDQDKTIKRQGEYIEILRKELEVLKQEK